MVREIIEITLFRRRPRQERFLDRLGQIIIEGKCAVYAWALMSNHVHILFKSSKQGIFSVMRKLFTCYSQCYNRRPLGREQ